MSTPEIKELQDRITRLEAEVTAQSEEKLMELSEKAINVVLDVDKHFDDKASRILSAMAFLTAAAAAIFTKAYSPIVPADMIRRKLYEVVPALPPDVTNAINKVTWEVPQASIRGIEWSLITFSVYILLVLVGAILYLTALGPFLNIPEAWRREISPDRSADKKKRLSSLLFFYFIAEVDQQEWEAYWTQDRTPAELQNEITDTYIKDSRKIAQNAKVKYTYLRVGSLFFIVAIFFLMALVAGMLSADIRVVSVFTTVGGIVWAITLAGVTKARPPRESKTHWVWILVALALSAGAVLLSLTVWYR